MSDRPDPYAAHAQFVRLAQAAPQLWRVIVMMLGFELAFYLAPLLVVTVLPTARAVEAYQHGTSAFGTLAQFATFGIVAAGFVFLLRVIHGRGFWSLVGSPIGAIVNLKRVGLTVGLVLLIIEIFPPWINMADLAEVRNLGRWIVLLPPALLVLLIQTGTEELYFRGYLQQQLACLSPSRWVWMGIPSIIFGLMHYFNGNGPSEAIMWAGWATLLGMACADLTARTGNLGAAVGLHLANNAFALLLVGVQDWPASGLALFLYPYQDPAQFDYGIATLAQPWAIVQAMVMATTVLIMWLAARIAIRR